MEQLDTFLSRHAPFDALGTDVTGRVESITPATANSFSLVPPSNTSGNFTKVTQLVPVRIAVNASNTSSVLLGSSVEVKIQVAWEGGGKP